MLPLSIYNIRWMRHIYFIASSKSTKFIQTKAPFSLQLSRLSLRQINDKKISVTLTLTVHNCFVETRFKIPVNRRALIEPPIVYDFNVLVSQDKYCSNYFVIMSIHLDSSFSESLINRSLKLLIHSWIYKWWRESFETIEILFAKNISSEPL